jgi:hypothetical protein
MKSNGRQDAFGRRIARLHLENWRNFAKADLDLERRVFLVGPNASGKSNFLGAFRFLHDIVSIGGGFQAAVEKHGGVSSIRSLAARRNPDIALRVEVVDESGKERVSYELRFAQDNLRRPLVRKEEVIRNGATLFTRPDSSDEQDPERLTQTHLEQVNVNKEYRDIVEFFGSICSPAKRAPRLRPRRPSGRFAPFWTAECRCPRSSCRGPSRRMPKSCRCSRSSTDMQGPPMTLARRLP